MENQVYVFNGAEGRFPSAIYSSFESADLWIRKNKLSGILTCYPLDISVYEWSLKKEYFKVTDERHQLPSFIQSFSSASQEHFHYEDGERLE